MGSDTDKEYEALVETLQNIRPGPHPKLEVWYGGREETLYYLLNKFNMGLDKMLCFTLDKQYVGLAMGYMARPHTEDSFYVCVLPKMSPAELENFKAQDLHWFFSETMNGETRNCRFILLTNELTRFLERSNLTQVYHFPCLFAEK